MKDLEVTKDTIDFFIKDKLCYEQIIKDVSNDNYLFYLNHSNRLRENKECYISDTIHQNEKSPICGPEFKYFINEDGFRSKSFLDFNKNNTNILFLGCSITQGVGLPEECMWTTKLVNKIKIDAPDKKIDHYNLSISGAGIHVIIKNFISFLNTVGRPDYVFAYMPQISRSLIWGGEEYVSIHYPYGNLNDFTNDQKNFLERYVPEDALLYNTTLIHLMEMLCNLSGIKLIWSTWYREQFRVMREISFNNYSEVFYNIEDHYAETIEIRKIRGKSIKSYSGEYKNIVKRLGSENINNEPYWSSARDGWHFGTSFHSHVAEIFYKELNLRYSMAQ